MMEADTKAYGSSQTTINALNSVMLALILIVVPLRIFARHLAKVGLWWDDYLIIFGGVWSGALTGKHPADKYDIQVITAGLNIVTFVGVSFGLGEHTEEAIRKSSPENLIKYYKILYATMVTCPWAMSAIKCSILLLYYRLFHVNKTLRYSVYALLIFVILWNVSFFFALVFQCTPVAFFWDRRIPGGHCVEHGSVNNNAVHIANGGTNVFTSFMLFLLPLPMVWWLRLSWIRKTGLLMVFLVGAFDCAVGVIRVKLLIDGKPADILWTNSLPHMWAIIELDMGITCACLPSLVPLLTRLFKAAVSKSSYLSNYLSGNQKLKSSSRSLRRGSIHTSISGSHIDMQDINSNCGNHRATSSFSIEEPARSARLERQGTWPYNVNGITITRALYQSYQDVTDDEIQLLRNQHLWPISNYGQTLPSSRRHDVWFS